VKQVGAVYLQIGPLLGRGSYGRVYKGRWHGAMVAVKVIDAMPAEDGSSQTDSARESILAASVSHPNVVSHQSADGAVLMLSQVRMSAERWVNPLEGRVECCRRLRRQSCSPSKCQPDCGTTKEGQDARVDNTTLAHQGDPSRRLPRQSCSSGESWD
jgi:Protein tyrosine and serine/threonine kinase